ncbi:MAG: pilin [Candidatus Dojkabacteria bacterium]|nr:pilin [Candidatus Dojkabacteria bacterium]
MLHNIIAADTIDLGLLNDINAGTSETSLPNLITTILNFAIGAAAVVCVVMLIAAGYSYITASGDEGKIEKATKTLTNAIIGLAICFIAVLLVNFVLTNILQASGTTSMLPFMFA